MASRDQSNATGVGAQKNKLVVIHWRELGKDMVIKSSNKSIKIIHQNI